MAEGRECWTLDRNDSLYDLAEKQMLCVCRAGNNLIALNAEDQCQLDWSKQLFLLVSTCRYRRTARRRLVMLLVKLPLICEFNMTGCLISRIWKLGRLGFWAGERCLSAEGSTSARRSVSCTSTRDRDCKDLPECCRRRQRPTTILDDSRGTPAQQCCQSSPSSSLTPALPWTDPGRLYSLAAWWGRQASALV